MTVMMERPEQLLNSKQAAERLAISVPSVERLIRRGVLPSLQVPGVRARRILESDLASFMRSAK
jgi:excisionase family DNA binding protein